MAESANYYEKVYAGVLGKVIGVYLGKPFEGSSNAQIEADLGEIWYYVHDRLKYPLVASDDDISGTFTFLRALADHNAWAKITSEQIGKTWLNYLIEHKTVLWWGGMGISTEHTAWLRLASGVDAPESGSVALNGRTVAEQIGAQIFIDGFGLVAPGDPVLAAKLAGEAARVSHDGEAVFAAQAVAAMEAAAFDESNMDKLFKVARSVMPADCLIVRVHDDVRNWAAKFGDDWRATFRKIQGKYGYDKFGGNCHMVPNHAVMVMAWAHAPDDFQKSLMIANTAGWDTDCNSGNVGCLMGVKDGLAGIAAGPDWQGPFGDRVVIPTAEGTRGLTDVLREADLVAEFGRKVIGWKPAKPPKDGARFHFSLPGSQHGFMVEREVSTEGHVSLLNPDGRLNIQFNNIARGKPARISTPVFLTPDQLGRAGSNYSLAVSPTLFSGQKLSAGLIGVAGQSGQPVQARLFIRYYVRNPQAKPGDPLAFTGLAMSKPVALRAGRKAEIRWTVPDTKGLPIGLLGLQIEPAGTGRSPAGSAAPVSVSGEIALDWLTWSGSPTIRFGDALKQDWRAPASTPGWIGNCKVGAVNSAPLGMTLMSDRGVGQLHIGTAEWDDYAVSGKIAVRLADRAGLAGRYAGLFRYVALVFNRSAREIQLVRQYDDRTKLLAKTPCEWQLNEVHDLRLELRGGSATGFADGKEVLTGQFDGLPAGGIALLSENGATAFGDVAVAGV